MSDETKCRACGKYNGPDDSSDSCHCPQVRDMDVSEDTPTPPTPDPRERGEALDLNINDTVEVTLTEDGMDAREAFWRGLSLPARRMPKRNPVWITQLWCVMQELGPATMMGGKTLIEGNRIRIALRAPAPSEAVAPSYLAVVDKNGVCIATRDAQTSTVASILLEFNADDFPHHHPFTVTPLYTHPAPARGVTVTEAMARAAAKKASALWNEDGAAYDEFWDDIKDEWIAILTAALTPDAP